MTSYANVSRQSNVIGYEIGTEYIKVQFRDGGIYTYTYSSAGPSNIEHMKTLARQGMGLNTFINQHVKKAYERKG